MVSLKDALKLAGFVEAQPEDDEVYLAEYYRELPPIHPLAGVPVRLLAYARGIDDIVLAHTDGSELVSVVHLTWIGREELPNHPTVEFTGRFRNFLHAYGAPTLPELRGLHETGSE